MGLGASSQVLRSEMSGPTANYVKEIISKDMVVIFSKSHCPYCQLAKEVSDFIIL